VKRRDRQDAKDIKDAKNGNEFWVALSMSAVPFMPFPRLPSFLALLASWR